MLVLLVFLSCKLSQQGLGKGLGKEEEVMEEMLRGKAVRNHLFCLFLSWTASLWTPEADLSWPLFRASLISLVEVSLDLECICHISMHIPGDAQC